MAAGAGMETEAAGTTEIAIMELTNWEKVVALLQASLGEGKLAEETTWQVVVLIPKGGVDYHDIGLLEVAWKVMVVILNRWFTAVLILQIFWRSCKCKCY